MRDIFRFLIGVYALVGAYVFTKLILARGLQAKFKWMAGAIFAPFPIVLVLRDMRILERPLADAVYAGAITAGVGYLVLALRYETTRSRPHR